MKKLFLSLVFLLAMVGQTIAATRVPAKDVTIDSSGFGGNIPSNITTVQGALQVINDATFGGDPGGANTQVQINSSGSFAGDPGLTYDTGTDVLSVAGGLNISGNSEIAFSNGIILNGSVASSLGITGGNLGVGTTSPRVPVEVVGKVLSLGTAGLPYTATNFNPQLLVRKSGGYSLSSSGISVVGTADFGGTLVLAQDSGASLGSGKYLGQLLFTGSYDNTNALANSGAAIMVSTDETWASSANTGSQMTFEVAGNGASFRLPRMTIDNTGFVGIGTQSPTALVDSSSATGGDIQTSRADTTVTAGDLMGSYKFKGNDSQLTTQSLFGKIDVYATNTVTTDAAAGYMVFYTTGTSAGGSPIEAMRITSSQILDLANPLGFTEGGTGLSAAADDTLLISSGLAWVASTIPNCTDTGGNHLNYTASTNSFSCGVSGTGGSISDTVYGVGWDGDTTTAPSKNAIYDKIETLAGGTPGGANTQVQFNNSGAFAGDADFTYNSTTNELTVGSIVTTPTTDPYQVFDVSTAGDSDFWMGVESDNNGAATGEAFRIGSGSTAFSNKLFSLATNGSFSYGDDVSDTITRTILASSTTNFVETLTAVPGNASNQLAWTGLQSGFGSFSPTLFTLTGTSGGGTGTMSGATFSISHGGSLVGTGRSLVAATTMSSTSGTQDLIVNLDTSSSRTGAGGTTTTFYGARLRKATVSAGTITNNYALNIDGRNNYVVDARTIADNGTGTPATLTLNPTSSSVQLTCSDANGCDITMSESGTLDGTILNIINVGANDCNFSDTSGVSETTGAIVLGQYDSISFMYAVDRWVRTGGSDN